MADLSEAELAKFAAARYSVDFVEDGMKLGLGTGSTAVWMVRCLAARVRNEGLALRCVPTSDRTAAQAGDLGLEVIGLDDAGWLDLTIDGADEIDPAMNLIKGGGGAHLREKIVAAASDRMVVIADPSKSVGQLGSFALPIEIVGFGHEASITLILRALEELGIASRDVRIRMAGDAPFRTDEGNLIADARLGAIPRPDALAAALNDIPGVVETGLFLGLCDQVVIGHCDGRVDLISEPGAASKSGRVDLSEAARLPV